MNTRSFRITAASLWLMAALIGQGQSGDAAFYNVSKVNKMMGVAGRGNVAVGPHLPWGSVNPGPDTPDGNSDGYSSRKKIRGFSQLHVTGTGSFGKYGQFLISPQIGLNTSADGHDSDKSEETAGVSEYKVRLTDFDIFCELTPTPHAAIYRFTFPASEDAHLSIDLGQNIPQNSSDAGYADGGEVFVNAGQQEITGWGSYWGGWSAEAVRIYFAASYDTKGTGFGAWINDQVNASADTQNVRAHGDRIGAYVKFGTTSNQTISLKIAVSFSSIQQAREFLEQEIPDWDYSRVERDARAAWANQLNQIQIEGASPEQAAMFYSTFYNTMRMPRDRTGDNPDWSSEEPYWDDYYCVWDTWRTLFPLHVLLHESMVSDNIRAFVDRLKYNGFVQDAFVGGNDRYYKWIGRNRPEWLANQGGDNVDNIIADAFVKGVPGVNWDEAYEVMKFHADQERVPSYLAQDRGWIPYRKNGFGLYCSRSLEFAYNDFCAAQMARSLGHANDVARYSQRSRGWENLWNPQAVSEGYMGFIVPRWMNGDWVDGFDPKRDRTETSPGGVDCAFYQGSSWIYSYFVPHDFARLIELCGGNEAYCRRLEFALNQGLIDFSNEPSFLTPFSFVYAGRPDLCAYWVRQNSAKYGPDYFPGDEDSGAMSSWYVFATLGLMPNAGQDVYLLSGPFIPKATLTLENGRQIIIEAENVSSEDIYIQSLTLNGAPWQQAWLRHRDIKDGATLRFVMGPTPSDWGTTALPPSGFR